MLDKWIRSRVAAVPVKLTWSDCGTAKTHGKINTLTPLTIQVPGATTLVGSGVLDSHQTSASFKFTAKKFGIPIVSGKGSICEDTKIDFPLGAGSVTIKGIPCPHEAGNVDVTVELNIFIDPSSDDNSLLNIELDAHADDTGDSMICMKIEANAGVVV